MKRVFFIIGIVLMIAGICFLAFPSVSNFVGKQIVNSEIESFNFSVDNIKDGSFEEALKNGEVDSEAYPIDKYGNRTSATPLYFKADIDRLYKDSVAYNKNIEENQRDLLVNEYSYANISLNLAKYGIFNGIYGYISAPTIDMQLPIYLGANASNMSYGAAHLTCTSLPIGGIGANAVLAGHTGYIGRIFFDNLRGLAVGDEVQVKNYWSTLKYTVVDAKVIKPSDTADIFVDEDKDLLTLITCVSNGSGGFNRYCVICERSE